MANSNERKSAFLGMSYSKASHQLRKKILFNLVQKLGLDNCFKCEDKIELVDELSIEHKIPWEGRKGGIELYWDLDNIAFSHLKCNRPEEYHGGTIAPAYHRVFDADGTICSRCKTYKLYEEFTKNASTHSGHETYCKECRGILRKMAV